MNDQRQLAALDRQEIMELRHAYGIATDLIGQGTPEAIESGRAIYRRIFTSDAEIGAAVVESVTGPDAWVDIVLDALEPYNATQHLIGTQHISLLVRPDSEGRGGHARMSSYLQAWHSRPDGYLWQFMGTYDDELVWSPSAGWQIRRMMLRQIAADHRQLGAPPA
ncbi:MAG: nuclear transport factor 2 family protein [Gammaproteobacteria bacterium]